MTARAGVYRGRVTGAGMKYDPSDRSLKTVFDLGKNQYRMIATDRVTRMTIGGQTYRSSSATN